MLNPFANRKVLKHGERAQARIVEMSTPEHGPEPSRVEMKLEVSFRGVPYEVSDRWMVSGTEPIGAGSEIWVAVDPEKRHRVAIDWDKTRADYRERTDVRRQVLSGGLPVPVTKVREAMEKVNGRRELSEPEPESAAEPEPPAEPEPEAEPDLKLVAAAAPPEAEPMTGPVAVDPLQGLSIHERELLSAHDPVAPVSPPIEAPKASRRKKHRRAAPAPPVRAKPKPASDDDDITSKLERLASLKDAGALTEGEFSAAKAHVLAGG